MKNKTTLVLLGCVILIFAVIGIGFIFSQPKNPTPLPQKQPVTTKEILPSTAQLATKLLEEKPVISVALSTAFPTLEQNYSIEREALYHKGEWYGAILQYKGADTNNRDTLRIVMHKKDSSWTLRTKQPYLLVNKIDIPDAPVEMLDAINKPAPLAGTPTSPAITPSE